MNLRELRAAIREGKYRARIPARDLYTIDRIARERSGFLGVPPAKGITFEIAEETLSIPTPYAYELGVKLIGFAESQRDRMDAGEWTE